MQILAKEAAFIEFNGDIEDARKGAYALGFANGLRVAALHTLEIMHPINAPHLSTALQQMKADAISISELITDCAMEQSNA